MQKSGLIQCKKALGRRVFLLLAVMLLCAQLNARSGMLWGEKNLRVLKTQWFDIIYPERSSESAAVLYERVDGIYEEVCEQYGLQPYLRMPVIITPAVHKYNAFWTAVPYNHIAIYDTGESGSSELAVFSEAMLSTFRHELTHAVTYNMKNGGWRLAGKIFGDFLVPGMFSITSGMAEGATLTSESAAGEGRLNDEYAKHYVKQAKIEGKFPSYHDVSGSADIAPGGAPYFFNGAFHQWLQDNYGMEPYTEFWYRVVNGKNITISGAFKKSFGIKLQQAWKQFYESYEIPEVKADPVEAGISSDFCRLYGSQYASLTAANNTIVWLDYNSNRVYTADSEGRIKKLFAQYGLTDVRLSNDGRFIAVSYFNTNTGTPIARVKIYDMQTRSFFYIKEKGLKDAVPVFSDGHYYLVAQKYFSQHYSLYISELKLSEDGRHLKSAVPVAELKQPADLIPYAFTATGDENSAFAWLKKDRMKYSLCLSDAQGNILQEYSFPEGMTVRSLSYSPDDNGTFYFSYAVKGSLPRLGKLEASTGRVELSSQDISGGVFEPVLWNGSLVYAGEFFRETRLFTMNDVQFDSQAQLAAAVTLAAPSDSPDSDSENTDSSILLESKPYNPLAYFTRGMFIPISTYALDSFSITSNPASWKEQLFLGATYITANPWAYASSDLYLVTAGWNPFSERFGAEIQLRKGSSSSLFNSQLTLKSDFDTIGWKQSSGSFAFALQFQAGNNSVISFRNTTTSIIRRKKDFTEPLYYLIQDISDLQYSNIKKAGAGRHQYSGFALGTEFSVNYDSKFDFSLGAYSKICIPHLLPFESKFGYTYNLPVVFTAKILPSKTSYAYTYLDKSPGRVFLEGSVESTLFAMEIQKAVPGITAVYLNDFYISAGYAACAAAGDATKSGFQPFYLKKYFESFSNQTGVFLDSVYLKAGIELTPNIGMLASSAYKMNFYSIISWAFHNEKSVKKNKKLKVAFGADINF